MRSKRRLNRLGLATIVGIAGVMGASSLVHASCAPPRPFPEAIKEAPAVFVGFVAALDGNGRWATVEIREVWTGGELPAQVEVRGGPGGENVATSVDRHYELSRRYLFVPYKRNGSVFRDSACSRTTPFRAELNRFRPASAEDPSPTPSPQSPRPEVDEEIENGAPLWPLLGAVLVGSGLIAFVLLRRQ